MARLHCDDKIRPQYVKEVCRLLKASNINIVKDDIEIEENQKAINEVGATRQEEAENRQNGGFVNDLFVSDVLIISFSNSRRKDAPLNRLKTRPNSLLKHRRSQRKSRLPTTSIKELLL